MALEDTLGLPPPDPQDQTASTPDQLAPSNELSVDPQTLADRLSRKLGVQQAQAQQAPPAESEAVPGELPQDILDRITRDQWKKQKQPPPERQRARQTPAAGEMFSRDPVAGVPKDTSVFERDPTAQIAKQAPASPDKEGGGVSASENAGFFTPLGKGIARGAVQGVGNILDYAPTESVAKGMAAGVMPGAEGMPTLGADEVAKQMQGVKTERASAMFRKGLDQSIPMSPAERESVGGRLGQGLGGMATVAPAIIAGTVAGGPVGGALAGASVMGLTSAADTFDHAIQKGATENQALAAAGMTGAVSAVLGALPLGAILNPIKMVSPELMGPAVASLANRAIQGGAAFAGIGEAQEFLAEQIAKATYDPKAGYDPDSRRVIANLLLGAGLGAGAHALLGERGAPTAGERTLPPPGGGPSGTGPRPGAEPPPGEGPGGGGQTFSPKKRSRMEDVATSYAEDLGDKHTRADIRKWSDQQLFDYLQEAQRRAAPTTQEPGEPPKPETKPEQPKGPNETTPPKTEEGPRPGTRENPIRAETPEDVIKAGEEVKEPTPAQAEAENHKSGHLEYEKLGLTGKNSVTIETPVGGTRRGRYIPLTEAQHKSVDADIDRVERNIKTAESAASDIRPSITEESRAHARSMADQFRSELAQFQDLKKHGWPEWEVKNLPYAYGRVKGLKGADGMNLDVMVGPGGHDFVVDQNDPKTGKFDEHKVMAGWPSEQAAREAYLAGYDDADGTRIRAITPITKDELWAHDWTKKAPYAKEQKPAEQPQEMTPEQGMDVLDNLFGKGKKPTVETGPKPTAETGPKPQAETPKPVEAPKAEAPLAEDNPTAEPLSDIKAQLADMEAGAKHRKGVYLPKTTMDHLAKLGVDPESLAPTPKIGSVKPPPGAAHATGIIWPDGPVRLPNFDLKGGDLIVRDKNVAKSLPLGKDNVAIQRVLGELTGAGTGKPANGTKVVQQRYFGGEVTRERLVIDEDVEKTKKEFASPSHTVHVVTPQEALKRRDDLVALELKPAPQKQEDEGETPETTPEVGGDAHDYVSVIEDAIAAAGHDLDKVSPADLRRAAELMAEGVTDDPIDAFVRAVALNRLDQGLITQQELEDVFQNEVTGILAGNEGGTPVHGGPAAETGPTPRPSASGAGQEGGEPPAGGETGGAEVEGPTGERPQVTQVTEGPSGAETGPRGGQVAKPEKPATPAATPSGGAAGPETGPRGGATKPQRTGATDGEPGSTAAPVGAGGTTPERPATGAAESPTVHEPPTATEAPAPIAGEHGDETPVAEGGETAEGETTVEAPTAETGPKPKLTGAGEKLRNARKFQSKIDLTDDLISEMNPAERVTHLVKDKIWTRPDYAELVADHGWDPLAAALLKRIYDRIPRNPKAPRFSNWSEEQAQNNFVKALRVIRDGLADSKTVDNLRLNGQSLYKDPAKDGNTRILKAAQPHTDYYDKNPAEFTRKDERMARAMVEQGFPNVEPWQRIFYVSQNYDDKWDVRRRANGVRVSTHDSKDEAIAAAKKLYEEQGTSTVVGETPERPHIDQLERIGPPNTRGDKDVAKTDDFLDEFGFLGADFGNWVGSQDERQKMLNLAWDALHDLSGILGLPPKAMGFNKTAKLSFGGNGRGGRGAGVAHYEADDRAINMTRLKGAGSLAHEWTHGLDHYLGELFSDNPYGGASKWMSGYRTKAEQDNYKNNYSRIKDFPSHLRDAVQRLMYGLYWKPESATQTIARLKKSFDEYRNLAKNEATKAQELRDRMAKGERGSRIRDDLRQSENSARYWLERSENYKSWLKQPQQHASTVETDYFKQAQKLSGKTGDYYKRPLEMLARATEAYIFDKLKTHGRKNDYLVNGVEGDRFSGEKFSGNPYPSGNERTAIYLLLDDFFKHLRAEEGVFPGSKIVASDYKNTDEEHSAHEVVDVATNALTLDDLIKEAIGVDDGIMAIINKNLSDAFADHLLTQGFANILEARNFSNDRGFGMDAKEVEESLELGVVKAARMLIENAGDNTGGAYNELVELYNRQPKLATRTSTSIRNQAYSTPIPLAYLASRIAGVTPTSTVYEPTAGNGALLIETSPKNATVNEVDPKRRENLEQQGFEPTGYDAIEKRPLAELEDKVDIVLANPPFGKIMEGGGHRVIDLSDIRNGYETKEIDHVIALRALKAMKDDGKAVLLLGSIGDMNVTPEQRFNGYNAAAKRHFYKTLYDTYNVIDHFTVGGDLWAKQGAQWPVDVVVIDGVGKSDLILPAVNLPPIFKSWDDLKGLLDGTPSRSLSQKIAGASGETGTRGPRGGYGGSPRPTRPTGPADEEPVGVQSGPDGGPTSGEPPATGAGRGDELPQGEDTAGTGSVAGVSGTVGQPLGLDELSDIFDEEVQALSSEDERNNGGVETASFTPPEQEIYEQVKPAFIAAAQKYPALFKDPRELLKRVLRDLRADKGWGAEEINNAKPYVIQFIDDVQRGTIKLKRAKTAKQPDEAMQVPYTPIADGDPMGTEAPKNMLRAMLDSLRAIQAKNKALTEFVADELGMSPEKVKSHLGAEQIEALAQAIYNIKNGTGSINADMTGIGKGRVAAMTLYWAHKHSKVPVFVTEKPSLWRDIYRDLKDVGFVEMLGRQPNILYTNALTQTLPLEKDEGEGGLTLKRAKNVSEREEALRAVPNADAVRKEYDLVFTTYPQMGTVKGKSPFRREWLAGIASDAVIVFDESHNAAGDPGTRGKKGAPPNRAAYARQLVQAANGAYYLSATWAKRADSMPFYAKTNLRFAISDPAKLTEMFAKGGIPLQQVVTANLAEDGQLLRRERSYKGINYDRAEVPVNHEMYNDISKSFSDINNFSLEVKEIVKKILTGQLAIEGEKPITTGTGAEADNVYSIGFGSLMHNAIAQMLLAMKAVPAAQKAIEAIKRGEKPVLTVANTMEAFLSDFITTENEVREKEHEQKVAAAEAAGRGAPEPPEYLKVGSKLTLTFKDVLHRYLERARTISIKSGPGKKDVRKHYLTDGELGPIGVSLYNKAKAMIESLQLADMPISPIDAIRNEITKAGYQIAEVTGRSLMINYSGKTPTIAQRPADERGQTGAIKTVERFNTKPDNGGIHAMIINQSGSTGISAHASKNFDDQSKRMMMIVQPAPDINVFMQMLGRVNRTGQVVLPYYIQLEADIPAETRPGALTMKKMASLNANTTAARGGALTAKDVPDFINVYGDEVAAQWLLDNPTYNRMMGNPLDYDPESGEYKAHEAMHRLTGKLMLLPINIQQRALNELTDAYTQLIEAKEAAGENMLEAKVLDLMAREFEGTQVSPGIPGETSRFAAPVIIHKASVRRLTKPYAPKEIAEMLEKETGLKLVGDGTTRQIAHNLDQVERAWEEPEHVKKLNAETNAALEEFRKFRQAELDDIEDTGEQENARKLLDGMKDRWSNLRKELKPGHRFTLRTDADGNKAVIVLRTDHKGNAANPLALSTWRVTFAMTPGGRQITLPFSRLYQADSQGNEPEEAKENINALVLAYRNEDYETTLHNFEALQGNQREDRYIITGNIVAGFAWAEFKGRLTHYTNGYGETENGILLPHDFDITKAIAKQGTPVQNAQELKDWLDAQRRREKVSFDGKVSISNQSSYYATSYDINVPKSKSDGGLYYLDNDLLAITGDFASRKVWQGYKKVTVMGVSVNEEKIIPAIKRLMALGVDFRIDHGDIQTYPIQRDYPEDEDETPPSGSATAASFARGMGGGMSGAGLLLTPEARARRPIIEKAIRTQIEQILGKSGAKIEFMDQPGVHQSAGVGWGGADKGKLLAGAYDTTYNIVKIAVNYNNPKWMQTAAFHESFHALQNTLLHDPELRLLKHENQRLRQYVAAMRPDLKGQIDKLADYEVEAIAFERFAIGQAANANPGLGLHVGVRRSYAKLDRFFRRTQNALAGLGFKTSEDIFAEALQGKLGARAPRTDKPLDARVRAQAIAVGKPIPEPPGAQAESYMGDQYDAVRERIADLWPTVVEHMQNFSHREKLLQREVEARFFGVSVEQLNKWHPGASKLPDPMQFYVKKELMPGRMAHNATEFQKVFLKPLVKVAEDNKIDLSTIGEFIGAKGAVQRNRQIAEAWRDRPDHDFVKAMRDPNIVGGSGWSRNEAEAVINRHMNGPKAAAFSEIWRRFQDIVSYNREMMISYGLESRATINEWRARGDSYVPYVDWEDRPEDAPEGYKGRAGSLGVRGPESRQATGRKSRADNPMVRLIDQTYRVIDRGEKNIHYNSIAQALAELKRQDVDIGDIAALNKVNYKRVIDKDTGLVREVPDNAEKFSPNAVWFKRGGLPRVMVFKDRKIAEAIKRSSPYQIGILRYMLLAVNKYKSLWTHYSPDFAARHFFGRYMVEGALNLQEMADTGNIDTFQWITQAFPGLGEASKVLRDIQKGRPPQGQMGRYAMEMQREGGSMAFRNMRDIDGIRNELSRALDDITGGKPVKETLKALRKFAEQSDKMFNVWDNATRLATYAQARRQGQTPQQAAYKAANATVNYRTAGLLSNMIGLVLPFNKIAVNTGARMSSAAYRSNRMRKVLASVFGAGAGIALWNYIMGGNDKDGIPFFEKMPPWERHLNLIVMNPFLRDSKGRPTAFKLPMPFNFAVPLSFGYHVAGLALKATGAIKSHESVGDHFKHMVQEALSAFTTVAEGGNWLDSITPELIKPFVHVATNRDWLGRTIHIDENYQKGPNAYSGKGPIAGRQRTGEGWKDIAIFLNTMSGGSRAKSGALDFYPEDIREVLGHPFGAQIRFGNEVRSTATSLMKGEAPKSTDVPISRVFFGTDFDAANRAEAFKRSEKARKPWKN